MATSSSAPWKQLLLSALESNSHLKHSHYFQLATVGPSARPSNRTVVFRGFEENSSKIQINTDCRTHKVDELKHCPFAEICWYFTESWEQFRISGAVDVIDETNPDPMKLQMIYVLVSEFRTVQPFGWRCFEQRQKSWFASSLRSRLQYLGPNPGLPCLSEQPSHDYSLDPSSGPVSTFCLLVLDPDRVDCLNLKNNQRVVFTCIQKANEESYWNSARINP